MLDDSLPYAAGSETSKAAAQGARSRKKIMARHIFDILSKAGSRGMTVDELDVLFEPLGERHNVVGPRTKDLADKGMVTRGPDKRRTRKDSDAEVCRVVPEARDNFDLYWDRPIKLTPTELAVHGFKGIMKAIAKQALEHRCTMPIDQAQQAIEDALIRLYATLR